MQKHRLVMIGLGIFCTLLTAYNALKGTRTAYWGAKLQRSQNPIAFWLTITLDMGICAAIVCYYIFSR
jgi:hypothetical protein